MQMKFKYKILHELKFNKIFKETRLERVTQHVYITMGSVRFSLSHGFLVRKDLLLDTLVVSYMSSIHLFDKCRLKTRLVM